MGQSYALRSVVDYAQSTSTVIPGRLRGEVGQSFYFILLREVGQPFYLRLFLAFMLLNVHGGGMTY